MAAVLGRAGIRLTPDEVKSETTGRIVEQERRVDQIAKAERISRMEAARVAYGQVGERFVERRKVPR